MDIDTVEREAREGNKPSEAAMQQAISRVGTDDELTAVIIIAEVGRNHPAYLAEFAEELGGVGLVEHEHNLLDLMAGVSNAVDADPSVFQNVRELLVYATVSGEDRTLQSVFQAVGTAAKAGETVPDNLIQAAALRIAGCTRGGPVQSGTLMFEWLVKAEEVNNTEAFDLIVGLVETGRKDIVRRYGNVLVDLILQKEIPEGADIAAASRVLEAFKDNLTPNDLPSDAQSDVQSALNMLESYESDCR